METDKLFADNQEGRTTSKEKILVTLSVIGVVVSVALLISLIVVATKNDPKTSDIDDICLTQACIMESANVLSMMNLSADPCDNFYEFACGSFLNETIIPDDQATVSQFSLIEKTLDEQLRVIIDEPIQPNEIAPFQNVKRLYQACVNTSMIDSLGVTPVKDAIDRMGGWPVVMGDSWDLSETWTWQEAMRDSKQNGYSFGYIYSFAVTTDSKNNTKRTIEIDQSRLNIHYDHLTRKVEASLATAYSDYQVDLAVLFGADKSRAVKEMAEAYDFEVKLAQISMSSKDRRDEEKLYNVRTIAQLQIDYPYNDWLSNFNSILPAESQLTSTDTVVVGALTYLEDLGDLLATTPNRVIANYIAWRQVMEAVDYLSEPFRQRQLQYEKANFGKESQQPRWMTCIESALEIFPHAFGALYARKHFDTGTKTAALEMVNNIKNEFKIMLAEITWMDEATQKEAKAKLDAITTEIGFADELLDDAKLIEYYNKFPVTIDATQYYASVFAMRIAYTSEHYKKLREAIDKNDWTYFVIPATINAFYSPLENSIKFPAGILQGAFFNAYRPQYMNYGGIGFTIGHEITHGFDNRGSQFDSKGNLRNWWANATRKAFLEKAKCIIDQYNGYIEPMTKMHVNGINTLGENIADNGGIKESYRAYVRWAEKNKEQKLPGLNFTSRQMFWVSAAQVWCNVYRKEIMKIIMITSSHSPGEFRVTGSMSNSNEFSEDFQCSPISKMNPPSKCEVW